MDLMELLSFTESVECLAQLVGYATFTGDQTWSLSVSLRCTMMSNPDGRVVIRGNPRVQSSERAAGNDHVISS